MNCKFCNSENVVKHGKRFDIQRYLCNNCNHTFYDNSVNFARMRVNTHAIVTALNLYYNGLSMRKVAEQLENIFGEKVSQSTIHYWVHKYAILAKDYVETLQPKLSGKYHHDETEIKVSGDGRYFWETIDEDTRFIVASLITQNRTSEDAIKVFQQSLQKQRPIAFFTDGSFAYNDAFNKVFYSRYKSNRVEWIRRVGIRARETNNIIERAHSSFKTRYKTIRGLKNDKSSQELIDGYVINYNFCRKHSSIKNTPAKTAGLEVEGWKGLIQQSQVHKTNQELQEKQELEIKVTNK